MRVEEKLYEVAYFLREMRRVQDKRSPFIYELSAFLSACKSVEYYLEKEYGEEWLKETVKQLRRSPAFKHIGFYLGKRDSNVHQEPLDVLRETRLDFPGDLPDDTRFLLNGDGDGNLASISVLGPDGKETGETIPFVAEHRYYFPDGEASGKDILAECEVCYRELARIVVEARREHATR